jgi:tRNA A-37 threonylcarbamoyl transferase component Bud32
MAELTVKSRAASSIRNVTEVTLDTLFPLWGIAFPLFAVGCMVLSILEFHAHDAMGLTKTLAAVATFLSTSVVCLLTKLSLSRDYLIVDKEGIHLPRLVGRNLNWITSIPWRQVQSVQAVLSSTANTSNSKIAIFRKQGRPIYVPSRCFEGHVIEQLILAAKMWNPQVCDTSLDAFQEAIRASQKKSLEASYTELWEDELSRRFCPTAYIALEPGKTLRNNTLKVVSHLASGGLSALYLAQLDNKQLVVLKEAVAPDECSESLREKAKELFEREAELLMKLDHPTIVHVLDRFTEGGRNYLLLEYINGVDLRQLVKQNGPQSEADVLEWAIQIAQGLKILHERETPIVHRDLTPDNIVLKSDGQVVIVDFGAANEFIANATGTFVGKNSYIAPEQFRGKASPLSDIYAFGCTLSYLLTGAEPEALEPSVPKDLRPSISSELSEFVESCTQLEAADRYQSVAQLLPVLRRLAAQAVVL